MAQYSSYSHGAASIRCWDTFDVQNQCQSMQRDKDKEQNCWWSHCNKHSHAKYVRVGEVMIQVGASLISPSVQLYVFRETSGI